MKSVVVGASAGLGRALAEELAERGHALVLIASDQQDLDPLARDLALRFDVEVAPVAFDLLSVDPAAVRDAAVGALGTIDNLFLIAGLSTSEDAGPLPDALAGQLINLNFTAAVRVINAFLPDLENNPAGNIVGIGSVAAARGRRNNSVYASAKRGLEFYFETLRHHLARHSCRTQFYRMGYIDTGMTLGQALPFPAIPPQLAARKICNNLGRDRGMVYMPAWWFAIMTVLKFLPWVIFRKLNI